MPSVQILKATNPQNTVGNTRSGVRAIRVAAYCRVSTDSDEQETSYDAQIEHYRSLITSHPGWILAGIFADEGITGTSASRRPEFNRLIQDCEEGHIDLVLTKSISRFARNTLDCLNYIRKLRALSIPIVFEKENINTMESSGEVLVTILASIAQQESASISANVRMGIEYGFQEGKCRFNYSAFLGLTRDPVTKEIQIVPEEAQIVRRIYRMFLDGYSPHYIAAQLEKEGVRAPDGSKWYATTVSRMLSNEKYQGDLLMQKYFVKDFLSHKTVRNEGQRPQYYVRDNHAPIVPRDVFAVVQAEKERRAPGSQAGLKGTLSGKVVCAVCGKAMRRFKRTGKELADWRCTASATSAADEHAVAADEHAVATDEHAVAVDEHAVAGEERRRPHASIRKDTLQKAVVDALNRLPLHRDELLIAQDRLRREKINTPRGTSAGSEEETVGFLWLDMQISIALRFIDQLRGRRDKKVDAVVDGSCADMEQFLRLTEGERRGVTEASSTVQNGMLSEFNADLAFRLVEKVTVGEEVAVRMKCGV